MFINKKTGASYGFVAPEISEDTGKDTKVPFPTFGTIAVELSNNKAEVDVKRTEQIIDLGDNALSADAELTLSVGDGLGVGCKCYVKFKSAATAANKVSIKTGTTIDCGVEGIKDDVAVIQILWTGSKWISIK